MQYLTESQLQFWNDNGYIIIKDYFTEAQKAELVEWVEDLESRPETAGKWMKYFEKPANNPNGRQLCRVENFLQFHDGFNDLLRGEKLIGVLSELMDEPAVLFKEKINFKLRKNCLLDLVCLSQHCRARLRDNLCAGELGSLNSIVSVSYLAQRCRRIRSYVA